MEKKIEDLEKSMKRSNDKQLKIELECCQKVLSPISNIHAKVWKTLYPEVLRSNPPTSNIPKKNRLAILIMIMIIRCCKLVNMKRVCQRVKMSFKLEIKIDDSWTLIWGSKRRQFSNDVENAI